MVEYTLEEHENAAVVKLRGSLDAYLRDFTPEVEKTIRDKPRHLVADLEQIDFIGSRGMGLLFHLHKVLTDVGFKLALASPSKAVRDALEVGGIGNLLTIYDTEAEALSSFG
jgi:anti-anti-sigma factor